MNKPCLYNFFSPYLSIKFFLTSSTKKAGDLSIYKFLFFKIIFSFNDNFNSSLDIKPFSYMRFKTQFLRPLTSLKFLYGLYLLGALGKAAKRAASE